MPSLRRRSPARGAAKAIPWLLVLEAAQRAGGHWREQLTPRERRRLVELLRTSRGVPGRLSPRERDELRTLTRQLDLGRLGRDLAPIGLRARGGRGRR